MNSFDSARPDFHSYPYGCRNPDRLHSHDAFLPDYADQQWQAYRQLELVPRTQAPRSVFTFGLGYAWKVLLRLLVDELVEEQRVDYLKRCWDANDPRVPAKSSLQKFFTLIE